MKTDQVLSKERFTVYCWYERGNRFQHSNFRRWNRYLEKNNETFEVIVFHDDSFVKDPMQQFSNLRFWRLHKDMRTSPTSMLNEVIRYARSNILVYVAPNILARKSDLYRLANFVRSDNLLAWLNPKQGFFQYNNNRFASQINRFVWLLNLGRFELYALQNSPFDFYSADIFSFNKNMINELFAGLSVEQKQKIIQSDHSGSGYLNYELFHHILKTGKSVINSGQAKSYNFQISPPQLYYSYRSTCTLLRQIFRRKGLHRDGFYFRINAYRFLLPVMQLAQLSFFVLVWFNPWVSLSFLVFYFVLAASLIHRILRRRFASLFMIPFWFFSWLFA